MEGIMKNDKMITIKLNRIFGFGKWNYVIPTDEIIETARGKYVYCYAFNYSEFSAYTTYMYGQYFPVDDVTDTYVLGWCTDSEANELTDLNFHGFIEKRLDIV